MKINQELRPQVKDKNSEFQLISVKDSNAPRPRDHHEGIKAKASDTHNWNNRLTL